MDKIEQDPRQAKGLQSRLRNVQGELQLIYTLARLEEQITNILTGRLKIFKAIVPSMTLLMLVDTHVI